MIKEKEEPKLSIDVRILNELGWIRKEDVLKLIYELLEEDIRFVDMTCKKITLRELKSRIEG